ncbi:Asp-tRNA(Asn)/Glu-tRNA(Gln) amidotransferase subunit GatC [Roseiconus lacunae]|uniref:Aspartyl/glutamyl-tRNA(Asn/Gln) amidotransferase subunit C n=1 Tax=Roseiconus lacunae TaxID=2605694 RepID=A0ABT7PHN8_9BACT|nr:Asp-tRNA(Asn)/Glu-tRNA(Gln) amidotransferase subunit GatC [Roseiconus lacunae]MCD0461185.1 Asp-tRNA(Asn)/Glu-tRNA(Gln) amidotransferase subunit GatC [Roseiconus lacunae]MDM4016011.1 Asp-tRNA(Asn)/Glu-tRNA(Gln) amidotransferase subunit GatC [Roseiconus lacunae]WRQ51657.1 Asp-tRNA(Asn)/Glu-tRNA(Gln) amidotransferase subunit GatC [Stieleria sp. HD01]
MALTTEDAAKLARLARLELPQEELEHLAPQLESILGFIDKLSELDTTDVEPMTTALDVSNRWRADEFSQSLSREQALANAPASDEECFRVPPVLG